MADKRKSNGGARKGAGRKSRTEEALLLEKLGPMDPLAMEAMEQGLKNYDNAVLKLFMSYKYGQPKQSVDVTTQGEQLFGVIALPTANE